MKKIYQLKSGKRIVLILGLSIVCFHLIFSAPRSISSEGNIFDWPQWRGLNRDGISPEKEILKEWPESGPEIVWRKSIGNGYSGITVSDGKLYTIWEDKHSQYLFCLEPSSGEELWRLKIGANFKSGWGHGPRSTPIADGKLIYAISAQGELYAADKISGKAVWSKKLNSEYGGENLIYGYSSSPLVDGDKLLVDVGGRNNFAFVALDKTNGDTLWNSQTDLQSYSSPIAVTLDGKRQIVFLSAVGLYSVSPEDGSLYWQYPWNARCPSTGIPVNVNTPVFIAPDKIFISGGYGTITGGALIQVSKTKNTFAAKTVWKSEKMKNLINSSVYIENHIYGFDDNTLRCIEASTGEEKWSKRDFGRGSLIAADGYLIVLGERGQLALIEANPSSYKETARTKILNTDRNWTSPSMANGKLYLRNHEEMVCLDMKGI